MIELDGADTKDGRSSATSLPSNPSFPGQVLVFLFLSKLGARVRVLKQRGSPQLPVFIRRNEPSWVPPPNHRITRSRSTVEDAGPLFC